MRGILTLVCKRCSVQNSITVTYSYRKTLSSILEQPLEEDKNQELTDRLVSLYLTLMSAAVRRMASIASSNVTE